MEKRVQSIGIRYALLLSIAIFNIPIFTFIFTTPTVFLTYKLLSLFHIPQLQQATIIVDFVSLTFIEACIAGSAYFLLTILHLSVPWKSIKMLTLSLLSSYFIFFIINILRIFLLAELFIAHSPYFALIHKILWYGVSTLVVIAIWFFQVYHCRINSMPFLTDIKEFLALTKKN